MSFINQTPNRPSRLDRNLKDKDSNAQYHLDYAKWAASAGQNHQYYEWLDKVALNKKFYKGDQWVSEEDVEAFLKDSSGQDRNRIQIIHNLIRPMVEQFRGNSIRLAINATCKSISPMAQTRRELALQAKLFESDIARALPALGKVLLDNDPTLDEDPEEVIDIFNNLYVDEYVNNINELMNYSESLNKFSKMKPRIAQNMALSGIGVVEGFNHGGHRRYQVIESEDFLFDRDAREYDLSDAAYMGKKVPMDPSTIFERYPEISDTDRRAIENQSSSDSSGQIMSDHFSGRRHSTNRIPVYEMYWKDMESIDYGYVIDEHGYTCLEKINHVLVGEKEPKYTDKDLIDYPRTRKNIKLFGKNKKRKLVLDVLRYCAFIPAQYVANNQGSDSKTSDIVLEFGMVDYQDTDYIDISNVKFPFKAHIWGYVDGEVFSPVDDAINPQRFINRIMSVFEAQVNNSGGTNVIIDEDALIEDDADSTYTDIADGRPISVRTKGRGVPNAVGYYDATVKAGTLKMLDIIPALKGMVQDTTGVNEALKGESTGSDQLVGVTELLIQRGSLMQEPFYDGIASIFLEMYQDVISVGKRYYIDNERELAIATGDDGVEVLKLSEDFKAEDFRAFINRDNDESMLQSQANQMLSTFMEAQLIDQDIFVNLYGRSNPDQVMKKLRDDARFRRELEKRTAREMKAKEQEMMDREKVMMDQQNAEAQVQQADQQAMQYGMQQEQHQHELDKISEKGLMDMAKEDLKNNEKQANI